LVQNQKSNIQESIFGQKTCRSKTWKSIICRSKTCRSKTRRSKTCRSNTCSSKINFFFRKTLRNSNIGGKLELWAKIKNFPKFGCQIFCLNITKIFEEGPEEIIRKSFRINFWGFVEKRSKKFIFGCSKSNFEYK